MGFAIEEADRARLARLVEKYGCGNRSAFLRVAMEYMEASERAERLRALQAYGAERAARRGLTTDEVQAGGNSPFRSWPSPPPVSVEGRPSRQTARLRVTR